MTTTEKETVASQALAGSYRRQIALAHGRAYRRAVKSFARDAETTEEAAKQWLASVGVDEPASPNGKGKK